MNSVPASFSGILRKSIRVIGVPLDLGQRRRGVDMGPFGGARRRPGRQAGGARPRRSKTPATSPSSLPEQKNCGDEHARYLREITATCTKLADEVLHTLERGENSALHRRRSLPGGRLGQRRGRILSPRGPAPRTHLDRRPLRHQHAGDLAFRATCTACRWPPSWDSMASIPWPQLYGWSPKVLPENCVLVGIRDVDMAGEGKHPPRRHRGLHHARHRRARHAHRDGRGPAHGRTRHRRLSHLPGHGLGRSRRRARRRHAASPAAPPTARRTSPWKSSPTTAA